MTDEQSTPAAERSASVTRAPAPERIPPPVVEVRPGVWKLARVVELEAEVVRLRAVAAAVVMFHRPDWTPERQAEWEALTGQNEASTRTLCDFARAALPSEA